MSVRTQFAVTVILCAAVYGCAEQAESDVSRTSDRPVALPAAPDAPSADAQAVVAQQTDNEQFVVYFGSFRDRLAAARYREHLHSMGLLRVNIRTAQAGVEMLVTDPMDQVAAQELAESLNGAVASVDWLDRTTRDYGLYSR